MRTILFSAIWLLLVANFFGGFSIGWLIKANIAVAVGLMVLALLRLLDERFDLRSNLAERPPPDGPTLPPRMG